MKVSPFILALLGWYLMRPPFIKEQKTYNQDAPLAQWTIVQSFDSAESCEKERQGLVSFTAQYNVSVSFAQSLACVATNDPRLAK
jgi:hypothetical protein